MNEPSNFCNGECTDDSSLQRSNVSASSFNMPPYAIDNQENKNPLNTKTLDMDAMHVGGIPHYNVHNLYGNNYK